MLAIRQYAFGGPEVLQWEEASDPVAGPGQLRIRVEAAGVHLLDTGIRRGETGGPFPLPELPMTPGREVAGVIDAVGAGVDEAWIGKRAVAHLGQASGGYAQLAVRDVTAVHELADHVDAAHAVAMIGTGRTTLAILEAAPIAPTDVVVVPAAAGGIGALLVQAALNADALVVGLGGSPPRSTRPARSAHRSRSTTPSRAGRSALPRRPPICRRRSSTTPSAERSADRCWSCCGPAGGSSSQAGRPASRRRSQRPTSSAAASP